MPLMNLPSIPYSNTHGIVGSRGPPQGGVSILLLTKQLFPIIVLTKSRGKEKEQSLD